jgi:hypothetical protein
MFERRKTTWKKLQKSTALRFSDWLSAGRLNADLVRVQQILAACIIRSLSTERDCEKFISRWHLVLTECDSPETFADWGNVLAYAHLHFLERYRRFYSTLLEMYKIGYLPMKWGAVRIVDVGSLFPS